MKKIWNYMIISILILLTVLLGFKMSVFAHPGRTDENGGHWDNSTGEYHYHHGYPAHDHYDIDGDGVIDCPYNFVDKAGQSSVSNSGSGKISTPKSDSSYKSEVPTYTPKTSAPIITVPTVPEEDVKEVQEWVYWVIGILIVIIAILSYTIHDRNEEISRLENRYQSSKDKHKKEMDSQKEEYEMKLSEQIQSLRQSNQKELEQIKTQIKFKDQEIDLLAEKNKELSTDLYSVIGKASSGNHHSRNFTFDTSLFSIKIPDDVYFTQENIPVKGKVSKEKPFGDFTVFVALNGKKYHTDRFCGAGIYKPVHIYDVVESKSPCLKCASYLGFNKKPPEWYVKSKAIADEIKKVSNVPQI